MVNQTLFFPGGGGGGAKNKVAGSDVDLMLPSKVY